MKAVSQLASRILVDAQSKKAFLLRPCADLIGPSPLDNARRDCAKMFTEPDMSSLVGFIMLRLDPKQKSGF